ncbi:MAG: histidine phosphatase family protein [Oscillospiraceae bacterium]|nr:histidine phosphatase family protein [Oscillospiraceae bacterium]
MKSYTIHLIRHGISEGNLKKQYIGSTDSPLSAQGAAEIRAKDEQGAYPGAALFFCSPMRRCIETMKIIYPDVEPELIDDLRECDFGDWEGKTADELMDDPAYRAWIDGSGSPTPPNGESGGVFMQRTCMAFEKLVERMLRTGKTSAVIVAHGGTIMSILSTYGLPRAKFYDWITEPGSGYSLRITPGLWMRDMVAEVYETIPPRTGEERECTIIDYAREAAAEVFREQTGEEPPENAEK